MKESIISARALKRAFAFIITAGLIGGAVFYVQSVSGASSVPSAKTAVSMGDLTALGTASASTGGSASDDTDWVTVMQSLIKTPNGKELSADVALQCGLLTDTTVKSKGGGKDKSAAEGDVSVRLKATNQDTGEERYFKPNEDGSPEVGVTYCSRVQELEAKFSGLNCSVDESGALTCEDPEELSLLLETLNANAFNFLLTDVESGVWNVEVQARAQASTELGGTELGDAQAEAFVGLGSTVIETIRLVKDADTSTGVVELD